MQRTRATLPVLDIMLRKCKGPPQGQAWLLRSPLHYGFILENRFSFETSFTITNAKNRISMTNAT